MQNLIMLTNPEIAMQGTLLELSSIMSVFIDTVRDRGGIPAKEEDVHSYLMSVALSTIEDMPKDWPYQRIAYESQCVINGESIDSLELSYATSVLVMARAFPYLREKVMNVVISNMDKDGKELISSVRRMDKIKTEIRENEREMLKMMRTFIDKNKGDT